MIQFLIFYYSTYHYKSKAPKNKFTKSAIMKFIITGGTSEFRGEKLAYQSDYAAN